MHTPNLVLLGGGIWMIGTGIDGVVPTLTLSGVLKVVGGILLIIASLVGG